MQLSDEAYEAVQQAKQPLLLLRLKQIWLKDA